MLDSVPSGPAALVLEGEAGIGKTRLWAHAIEEAERRSWRVLRAQPTTSETPLSFSVLTDLLSGVRPEVLIEVPAPQRRALDIALLRVDPEGALPDHRALATGFLSVLSALARRAPIVIAVDDAQWLDAPSARVLEFALRRLTDDPVGVVACARLPEQTAIPFGLDRALPEDRLTRIRVGPLTDEAVHSIVEGRFESPMPRRVLRHIAETSSGNPFFAIEIARTLADPSTRPLPGQDLPIPTSLNELVAERIAALPDDTRELLSAASAAADPTIELLESVAGSSRVAEVLAPAERAGVIEIESSRVRFAHPLLAAGVWTSTDEATRQRIHHALAGIVTDPEERAKHVAVVGTDPAEVADVLETAARHARARGAPDAAAEFYERSISLPATDVDDRWRPHIDAAECHTESGDDDRARHLLEELVGGARPGRLRAEAFLQLANISYRLDTVFAATRLLEQALEEAGDDANLRSAIERRLGFLFAISGNSASGLEHTRVALDLLEGSPDSAALSEALAGVSMAEFLVGRGVSRERIDWALAFEQRTMHPLTLESRPSLISSLILLWTDDLDASRSVLQKLQRRLVEEGDESALPHTNWMLSWVAMEMGDLERAASLIEDAQAVAEAVRQPSLGGLLLAVAAWVHAWRGEAERSRELAQAGLTLGMKTGVAYAIAFNTIALGFLELSLGNARAAHSYLGPATDMAYQAGVEEPGILRFLPDEIEALVALGELEKARAILDRFEAKAMELDRTLAIATSARCRAVIAAASGDGDAAVAAVDEALDVHRKLPHALELGRTYVVKGRVHRRRREKRAARESLLEAVSVFERAGAPLWEGIARTELTRLGGRPPAPSELTATELRVAELAASGLTNRQVAEAAFLSPKTVEGVLARVYRKLGINSRAELGAKMSSLPEAGS
jgi:DNA-binding CsgD family transcriptional regulator